jgi:hypothetical protein
MVDGEGKGSDGVNVNWKKRVQDREAVRDIFTWHEDRFDELVRSVQSYVDRFRATRHLALMQQPGELHLIADTLLDMYLDIPSLADPTRVALLDELDADDISEAGAVPHAPQSSLNVAIDASTAPTASESESKNATTLHSYLVSPVFQHLVLHCATRETQPILRPIPGRLGSPLRRTFREIINPNLSRLHCLLPPNLERDDKLQCDYRGFVRELVYSSSHYQERNEWAPLDERGRVDWRLVDAISTVMSEYIATCYSL